MHTSNPTGSSKVGLLLSNRAKDALIFKHVITSRIIMAKFNASTVERTVSYVYITHQGRAGGQKPVYDELNKVIATVLNQDCLVGLGDFNSRLGWSDQTNDFKELRAS